MTVPAKEERYSDLLDYFSGSMGIVSLNFSLPYLGLKEMQVFLDKDASVPPSCSLPRGKLTLESCSDGAITC